MLCSFMDIRKKNFTCARFFSSIKTRRKAKSKQKHLSLISSLTQLNSVLCSFYIPPYFIVFSHFFLSTILTGYQTTWSRSLSLSNWLSKESNAKLHIQFISYKWVRFLCMRFLFNVIWNQGCWGLNLICGMAPTKNLDVECEYQE